MNLNQFIDFVYSFKHQTDQEDQNRETFLILDRTCKKLDLLKWKKKFDFFYLGKGFLNKDDFIRAFERINVKLNPETINAAFKYDSWFNSVFINKRSLLIHFRQLDVDGDGRVSYRDFDFMMNYVVDEWILLICIMEYKILLVFLIKQFQ